MPGSIFLALADCKFRHALPLLVFAAVASVATTDDLCISSTGSGADRAEQDALQLVGTVPFLAFVAQEMAKQQSFLITSGAFALISGIVGVITYGCMILLNLVRENLYTFTEIRQRDQLYHWLLDWLASQREVHEKGTRVFAEMHPDFHKEAKVAKRVKVRFLPIDDGSVYLFKFAGSFIWISHHNVEGQNPPRKGAIGACPELRLRITVLGRSKHAIQALFQAAFEFNKASLSGRTEVFVAQPHDQPEHTHWRRLEPRRNRPLSTIVSTSEPGPEALLNDMKEFFADEAWYAERGVPYRRGYLFHGPPGCGKTSFVTAAAGELKCPIYILNLAEPSLSDLGLLRLVTDAQAHSILLMEDVDAAFQDAPGKSGTAGHGQREAVHVGLLTFSGLLNALDGVAGQEGKLVIMTTNHPEKLDGALVRPGRVDLRACFHNASQRGIEEIFFNFFAGSGVDSSKVRKAAATFASKCPEQQLTIAAVQGHLMQFRGDPHAAASSAPPLPSSGSDQPVVKQFMVPLGAASVGGGGEEE